MNNIRNLRKAKGLTIPKLSELTCIPVRTIEDYESEKSQIAYYHRLKAFCKALDCDIDNLMTKEEKCVYDGISAVIWLTQMEDGVCIDILDEEELNLLDKRTTSRANALLLLQHIKENKDVKQFFDGMYQ